MEEKGSSRTALVVLACGLACVLTAISTLLITRQYYPSAICQRQVDSFPPMPRLHFPKKPEWDSVHRIHIREKNITAMITDNSERCYLMPLNEAGEKRAHILLHDPLSEELIEEIGGDRAVHFCEGLPTYLLREINTHEEGKARRKRQAEERKWGGDLPYEQRTPRCMDLVLDCGLDSNIGQTQECYTWINGVLFMKQICDEPTKFSIYMSKPPGRILKIAQREWKDCLLRRQRGERC